MQQLRSRNAAGRLCRRQVTVRAEVGEGGSSAPGLIGKPSLTRPPARPSPSGPSPRSRDQGSGAGLKDRPPRQDSGGGNRRPDSFREGSAGNGIIPDVKQSRYIRFHLAYERRYKL